MTHIRPQPMPEATSDNPIRVILVGSSPVEQSLRRDSRIELIRAPGPLNAIGELASLPAALDHAPVVVFASVPADPGDLERCLDSLRRIDRRVRIVGVRPKANGTTGPMPTEALTAWIEEHSTGDDLRAVLRQLTPERPSPPAPAVSAAAAEPATGERPPGGPWKAEAEHLDALLGAGDPLALAVERIAQAAGDADVAFTASDAGEPSDRAGWVRVPVVRNGHTFGWLVARESARGELERASGWLASWLALIQQQAQLRTAAFTDPLTGARNRRYFDRFLARALDRARERRHDVTLLLFDIDDFKSYNDRFGHAAGDEILCEIVRLLGSGIRPTDRVARVGGDEFVVVFDSPEGPRDPAVRQPLSVVDIIRRFQQQVVEHRFPKLGQGARGDLTISGGMATFPWDGADAAALVERADRLLLDSKRRGKNLICLGPGAQQALGCGEWSSGDDDGPITE